ncbi:hypothetical protein [Thiomicrorhabdus sp.]|uniref:hypothetical protein n=1 Tax=Thiomicrorhabdus sp. TaxID=2039724 RepID=UPI0029C86B6D|nr:hypothetical protein [Thiomicrorhabdus sp.]
MIRAILSALCVWPLFSQMLFAADTTESSLLLQQHETTQIDLEREAYRRMLARSPAGEAAESSQQGLEVSSSPSTFRTTGSAPEQNLKTWRLDAILIDEKGQAYTCWNGHFETAPFEISDIDLHGVGYPLQNARGRVWVGEAWLNPEP